MTTYIGGITGLMRQPLQHASGLTATVSYGVLVDPIIGDFTQADVNDLDTQFRGNWAARMDSEVTFLPGELYHDGVLGVPQALTISEVAPSVGTSPGARAPGVVSVIIQRFSGAIGRRNRGRFWLPWSLQEADMNEAGAITAGAQTVINASAAAWLADVQATLPNGGMVILHDTTTANPQEVTPVVACTCAPVIGVQRRRRP